MKDNYSRVILTLNEYKFLKPNWDGYGGVTPKTEVINSTIRAVNILKSNNITDMNVMVSGDGDISLFWKSFYNYLEIEFGEDLCGYYSRTTDGDCGEDNVLINERSLLSIINTYKGIKQ